MNSTAVTPTGRPAHLIGLDIDGTLLVTGQRPSDAVVDALKAARLAGHVPVLATGRSLAGALNAARELQLFDGWIIASNGSIVVELLRGAFRVKEAHRVQAEAVVTLVMQVKPNVRIAAEIPGVGYHVSARFPKESLPGEQVVVGSFAELWAQPTPRLALFGDGAAHMVKPIETSGMTAIPTRSDWVDVTPGDVSKATALEKLRREIGIPQEHTVAIGDSENDIPMFEWAARSFAMGNATSIAKFAAKYSTKDVVDDGAALVLNRLVKQEEDFAGETHMEVSDATR